MDKDKIIRIEAHNSAILLGSNSNTITNGTCLDLSELDQELLRIFRMLPMQHRIKFMSDAYDMIDQALKQESPPPDGEGPKEPARDYLFSTSAELTPEVMAEVERFAEYVAKNKPQP